jgi:hypothetical protein
MNWRAPLILLALLAPRLASGSTLLTNPEALCRPAIAAAERAHGIPSHLLAAVARVESGRKDPTTGKRNPWPWTINFDGQGSFYDDKMQAVMAATAMRPKVTRSIDVGCLQVSLTQHPNAFASMDQAFDPMTNADYGGKFLRALYDKTGSWPKAVAMYHSATPELGDPYQAEVYAAWPEELQVADTPAAAMPFMGMSPFGADFSRAPLHGIAPTPGVRIIPLQTGGPGSVMQGKSLAAYRAAPVRIASRMP